MIRVIEEDKKCIWFKDCEELKTYLYDVLYVGVEKGDIKRKFLYKKDLMHCTHHHIDSEKYKHHDYKTIINLIHEMIGSFKNYTIVEEPPSKYLAKIWHLKNENRVLAAKLKKYQKQLYKFSSVCGDHVISDHYICASLGYKESEYFEKETFVSWNNLIANTAKKIGANGNKMQRYRTLIKQKEKQ